VILSRVNKTKSHKVGGDEWPEGVETLEEVPGAGAEATGRRPSHGGMDRPFILRDSHLPLPPCEPPSSQAVVETMREAVQELGLRGLYKGTVGG
jgi:hypothetical protein